MSVANQIISILKKADGLTDREITDSLSSPRAGQQPINAACRSLERKGFLKRRRRVDGLIGNFLSGKVYSSTELVEPAITSKLSEDGLKQTLKEWLEQQGWEVKVAWGHERGIDIEATSAGNRWVIEVKGQGSLQPMNVNFFLAILGETLQRMTDEDTKYSIALPDIQQFRRLWDRLPKLAKHRTKISALFVSSEGQIFHAENSQV